MDHGVRDPARLGQTRLPDGRRLAWAEWGPQDGWAVLLCPGAATTRWLGFGGSLVEDAGIRLVSVDRPGLGASDAYPGRTLASWTADIQHFIRSRELGDPAVVGFSQGAPFALALAAAGAVSAAAIVSGSDELAGPRFTDAPHPHVRAMVDAVASDPDSAAVSFADFGSADALWDLIMATSCEIDRTVYADPVLRSAFRHAMGEAFAQGTDGYARDTVLAMGRWPFDPARITVPVDLWYGRHDTSPSHSPDHGASLSRLIPTARRHVLPDAAGSLLWTHTDAVLRSLLAHRDAR
ncbi:alpha/beta hydrolase [Streptomyces sp. NBC_01433]|uniref:alpha/beta fold hydrolase n=1 Tax=Streptomyces sp. NBC_01433 TaxID=2903864 RepID=UPI0022555F68|nr:alpha/beta hydrolase [Streptomyces sp. NBC_01433]MCX4679371.1 alpha/beta hydrolase [Streptomyces sp. NBC_01433]